MQIGDVIVEVQRKKTELHLSFQIGKTRFVTTTTRSELAEWERFFADARLVNRTHYDVLGVLPTASDEDIRKAYKRLVRQHHPDLHEGDATSDRLTKILNEAYAVLSDRTQRKQYDESLCR
jgi:DnaJ-domain-containing protein 1